MPARSTRPAPASGVRSGRSHQSRSALCTAFPSEVCARWPALLGRRPVEVLQAVAQARGSRGTPAALLGLAAYSGAGMPGNRRRAGCALAAADASRCHRRRRAAAPTAAPRPPPRRAARTRRCPDRARDLTHCSGDGAQRVRPLQDRHRAVELAHGGADARGARSRGGCETTALLDARRARAESSCSARWAPPARATAATRRSCWAWQGETPDSVDPSTRRRALCSAIRGEQRLRCSAQARRRLRRARRPRVPPARDAAAPPQRHALHAPSTRDGADAARADLLLGRRRLRGATRRPPAAEPRSAGPTPRAAATRSAPATSCCALHRERRCRSPS